MLWRKESALKHRSGGSRAKDITGQQSRASHDLAVGTHPPRPSEGDLASEVGGGGGASRRASSCSQASHSSYNTHAGAGLLHAPAKPGQSVSLAPFKSMSSQAGASLGCMEGVDDWVPYQQLVDEAAAVATAVTPHAAASPDPAAAQTHPLQHEGSQALVTGSPFGASPFADPSYSGLGGDASNPRQGGGMGMGLAGMRRASSRFSRLFHALSEIGSVDLDAELDQDLGLTGTGHDGSSTHSSSVFGLASPSSRPLPAGAGGGGMGLGTSTPLTLRNRLHKASSAQLPGMHAEPSSLLRGLDVAGLPSSRAARAMDADGGGGGDGQASWFERRSKWRLTRRTTQALPHGHDR